MTRRLYVDQIFYIIRTNIKLNFNRAETERVTGFSRPTIDLYCDAADLPKNKSGWRADGRYGRAITQHEEAQILRLYEPLARNAERIAERIGRCARTVRNCLIKHKLKPQGKRTSS
jgi:hypothetical protein